MFSFKQEQFPPLAKPVAKPVNIPVKHVQKKKKTHTTNQDPNGLALAVRLNANGKRARALIDTATIGTNLVSDNFCYQNRIQSVQLKEPKDLNLAVKGSRSKINRQTTLTLELAEQKEKCNFHIQELNSWDIILGMPFLRKHLAIINLGNRTVFLPKLGIHMEVITPYDQPRAYSLSCSTTGESETDSIQPQLELNTDFDPVKEYPEVFPPSLPAVLPPLHPGFDHWIKLIDLDKKLNPSAIP